MTISASDPLGKPSLVKSYLRRAKVLGFIN